MPSLQIDVPRLYHLETKQRWARELGETYARIMQTPPDLVTVAIHALGLGAVWRCTAGEPHEAALVMCDVRAGRPAATRAELAEAVIAICAERGALEPDQIKVEFTQHPGDEMYHPHLGGFNHDWTGDERAEELDFGGADRAHGGWRSGGATHAAGRADRTTGERHRLTQRSGRAGTH